jgi:two-component system, cell cycle response regulator
MPRPVRGVVVIVGAWLVMCELHGLGVRWAPSGPEKWLHLVMMGLGAGLCIARGAIRPRERAAWIVLGLAVLAWTLGELYFTAVLWSDASPPVPSPADAGYLSLPPLIILGVVLLTRSRIRGLPRMVFVDGLIAGLAGGAMSAAIVFEPVLDSLHGLSISVITNFAYPVCDLVMLGVLIGLLAIGGRRLDRRLGVLAVGVLFFWASDTIYLIKVADGTWVSGGPFDPGWWTIAECVAIAAWMDPVKAQAGRMLVRARPSIRIPVAFALVAIAVLVAGSLTPITVPAVVLAGTSLVGVLVRLVLTFRAHQGMLDSSRTEASTDPLTGLGNRRALAAALESHLDEDKPEPVVLGLFDLDGFKSYNDCFGHGAGDELLRRLADALTRVLPPPAAAYRMGGDEFCVLVPAGEIGREMLADAHAVLAERGDGFAVSASIGSVDLPREASDATEALRVADQRMYEDKHSSRRSGIAKEVARTLLAALAQRDPHLTHHLSDVERLAAATARAIGLPQDQIELIALGAELHDVGKIAIPEGILQKPGPLDEHEWTLMREHTLAGERILDASPALRLVGPLVRSSHERWDGKGYPDGLSGSAIPLGARVIAVCDSYDAMTSDRSYRRAMSEEVAIAELRAGAGSQFDPQVVAAFLRVCEQNPSPSAPQTAARPEPGAQPQRPTEPADNV